MIEKWSISAHRAYRTCPRQFFLQYLAKVEQDPGKASIRGQVLHAGCAAGYAEHARATGEGRIPMVIDRRVQAAVSFAITKAATELHMESWEADEAYDTVMDALTELAPPPGDVVLGVEVPLEIEVDGVPIFYRADALYRRRAVLTVRDWKSRKGLPRARDLSWDRQLTLGALCAARTYDETRVNAEIASIGSGVAVHAPISVGPARRAGELVAETARLAEADTTFEPAPGAACTGCSVRSSCPVYANGEAPAVVPGRDGAPVVLEVAMRQAARMP